MQSTSYSLPADHHAGLGDALHALAVGVDEVGAGLVERLQVLVVEAGPLAELPVPRLEALGRVRVLDDRVDPGPDLLHLLEVGVLVGRHHPLGGELVRRELHDLAADAAGQVGPAVHHQVFLGHAAGLVGGEVLQPPLLPARRVDGGEPLRVDRVVVAHVDRRRRALEDVELLARRGEVGDALHRRGAGADDADPLVGQLVHRRPDRVAAGVVVVPAAGVEGVALEVLEAGDAGELRHVQRPGAHGEELRRELVAAVGADDPRVTVVVPLQVRDLGVEQRVVVEAELLPDALAVLEDLGRVGVLLGGHVPGLLEQRHVHEARRVALGAGVAVPVPGAAEVAALLDDADVVDAGLLDAGAGDEPREAAADERDRHVVGLGLALDARRVRVLEVVGQLVLELQVLLVPVGPQPLGPLLGVLLLERVDVDRGHEG